MTSVNEEPPLASANPETGLVLNPPKTMNFKLTEKDHIIVPTRRQDDTPAIVVTPPD